MDTQEQKILKEIRFKETLIHEYNLSIVQLEVNNQCNKATEDLQEKIFGTKGCF
ncbi:hypothetical protein [Coxiella-like endosymbiont]|uniref:hypothetical protein n=1 Tax=Coxiella-like endosymbiont TaxID=1592897 RepID=UPI00272BAB24|nr:hypothetical protein [Coxiella-like endosymbiont]